MHTTCVFRRESTCPVIRSIVGPPLLCQAAECTKLHLRMDRHCSAFGSIAIAQKTRASHGVGGVALAPAPVPYQGTNSQSHPPTIRGVPTSSQIAP